MIYISIELNQSKSEQCKYYTIELYIKQLTYSNKRENILNKNFQYILNLDWNLVLVLI